MASRMRPGTSAWDRLSFVEEEEEEEVTTATQTETLQISGRGKNSSFLLSPELRDSKIAKMHFIRPLWILPRNILRLTGNKRPEFEFGPLFLRGAHEEGQYSNPQSVPGSGPIPLLLLRECVPGTCSIVSLSGCTLLRCGRGILRKNKRRVSQRTRH